MRTVPWILLLIGLMTLIGGCAKLPLDNEAPGTPVISSDGILTPYGVAVRVTVDDADSDMVTINFQADSALGGAVDFAWTSFIASGEQAEFYLNLSVGQWTITARARDEWEELSPPASYDLVVQTP
jgi:hypothetical protein